MVHSMTPMYSGPKQDHTNSSVLLMVCFVFIKHLYFGLACPKNIVSDVLCFCSCMDSFQIDFLLQFSKQTVFVFFCDLWKERRITFPALFCRIPKPLPRSERTYWPSLNHSYILSSLLIKAPQPISMGEPSHPTEEARFKCCSFNHGPNQMIWNWRETGESRDLFLAQLFLSHYRSAKHLHYSSRGPICATHRPLHPPSHVNLDTSIPLFEGVTEQIPLRGETWPHTERNWCFTLVAMNHCSWNWKFGAWRCKAKVRLHDLGSRDRNLHGKTFRNLHRCDQRKAESSLHRQQPLSRKCLNKSCLVFQS